MSLVEEAKAAAKEMLECYAKKSPEIYNDTLV